MAAGLLRGLSHEDAARFSFLLATPVILAAGVLKVPSDLFGQLGSGIRLQVLVGSLASFVGAYLSVRFLTRYFHTRTLTPFAIYCGCAGLVSLLVLTLR
jgi:undecaprenyl-diphosphatase